MTFDYNHYYTKLYEEPLLFIIVSTLFLVSCLFIGVRNLIKSKKLTKRVLELFVAAFFSMMFLSISIYSFTPSIKLDSPSDTYTIQGEISTIDNVFNPPRFYYEGKIVSPKIITIQGKEYYIMTIGYFEVGDRVVIEYLENSNVILFIDLVE